MGLKKCLNLLLTDVLQFNSFNWSEFFIFVSMKRLIPSHEQIPVLARVYNGEGEYRTALYAVKNEPVK